MPEYCGAWMVCFLGLFAACTAFSCMVVVFYQALTPPGLLVNGY
jgi:hypothetical protein